MNNTTSPLLERLRTAWQRPLTTPQTHAATKADLESLRSVVSELEAIRGDGIATERCAYHLPPFDAIEEPDRRRPNYFRLNCRLCGTFLGYRAQATELSFDYRS